LKKNNNFYKMIKKKIRNQNNKNQIGKTWYHQFKLNDEIKNQ